MMRKDENEKIDWFSFAVHFFFGMFMGAVVGLGVWARLSRWYPYNRWLGVLCIGGGALLGGLFAGLYGDNFWEKINEYWRWPWW
jgi:hypothetical protein